MSNLKDFLGGGSAQTTNNLVLENMAGENLQKGDVVSYDLNDKTIKKGVGGFINKTESVFNSGSTYYISSVALDSTHVMISYRDASNSSYGTSIIGTINGTSITWGNESVFNNGSTGEISPVVLDSTHVMVNYKDGGNSYYGTSQIIDLQYYGYDLTFADQGAIPTNAWKPSYFDADVTLDVQSATTSSVTVRRTNDFYNMPKKDVDSLDLVVNGTDVTDVTITDISSVSGSGYTDYTFTFDTQTAAPTKAKIHSDSKLLPSTMSYYSTSDSIEIQYPDVDFEYETKDIRQLKYFMNFDKNAEEWIYLYSDLYKKS